MKTCKGRICTMTVTVHDLADDYNATGDEEEEDDNDDDNQVYRSCCKDHHH